MGKKFVFFPSPWLKVEKEKDRQTEPCNVKDVFDARSDRKSLILLYRMKLCVVFEFAPNRKMIAIFPGPNFAPDNTRIFRPRDNSMINFLRAHSEYLELKSVFPRTHVTCTCPLASVCSVNPK